MSRISEAKEKYSHLGKSVIDVVAEMIDPTPQNKYLGMISKILYNNDMDGRNWGMKEEQMRILNRLREYGISEETLNSIDEKNIIWYFRVFDEYLDQFKTFVEFIKLNERGLIDQKDLQKYNTLESIKDAISVSYTKNVGKEMEKHVIKLFEDEEWLVIRPLTFPASSKYGANTKWCTTMVNEKRYFFRYWNRGTLIYILNKKSGYKIAAQKYHDEDERSTLWNAADKEIDWIQADVPSFIYEVVKKEINKAKTNASLCDYEIAEQVRKECDPEYMIHMAFNGAITLNNNPRWEEGPALGEPQPNEIPAPGEPVPYPQEYVAGVDPFPPAQPNMLRIPARRRGVTQHNPYAETLARLMARRLENNNEENETNDESELFEEQG